MTGNDANPIEVAQRLTASLDGMREGLETATRYGHRNRRMIWGLVISLVLDVVLTVVIVSVKVQAKEASDKAGQVHTQQVVTCESTNESRALNVRLWDYVLSIPPSKTRTEAQEKQVEDFKAFIRKTFAPRDCSKI